MTQQINDLMGQPLGELRDMGERIEGYDRMGHPVGTYYKSSNLTTDIMGRPIAEGNVLAGLLFQPK